MSRGIPDREGARLGGVGDELLAECLVLGLGRDGGYRIQVTAVFLGDRSDDDQVIPFQDLADVLHRHVAFVAGQGVTAFTIGARRVPYPSHFRQVEKAAQHIGSAAAARTTGRAVAARVEDKVRRLQGLSNVSVVSREAA